MLPASLVFAEILTRDPVGRGGRIPFPTDPIAQAIIDGKFATPENGKDGWKTLKAGDNGGFSGIRGYSFATFESPQAEIRILEASGHSMVYTNGQPRMGDPYSYGYLKLPFEVQKGRNELLFTNGRGILNVSIRKPRAEAELNTADPTYPDFLIGSSEKQRAALPILNATTTQLKNLELVATAGGVVARTKLGSIAPLTARKLAFDLPSVTYSGKETEEVKISLRKGSQTLDEATIKIRWRNNNQSRRITFTSQIDGSLQYYAIVPPRNQKPNGGLVLSVHGASVEAQSQAEAYSQKDDIWVVSATNRRPYGFDWEDWGRMDAMEVLAEARKRFKPDPNRIALTGHSMGGHGTWSLGAIYPDLWSAIAPSAGWRSFYSYTGTELSTGVFRDAAALSDPANMLENYRSSDIFILHGDADDNVPVREARGMKALLEGAKIPFGYHEQPGANHWWDGDRAPGADCLEWPELFDTLAKARRNPWRNNKLVFTTYNPAVSNKLGPIEIRQQIHRMKKSRVEVLDNVQNQLALVLKTENVRALVAHDFVQEIDGQAIGGTGHFVQYGGVWRKTDKPAPLDQGPLKQVMTNRMVLITATDGTPEENRWTEHMARFHAEQFGYRGNGSLEIVRDRDFRPDGRTAVVYGNEKINKVWSAHSPQETASATLFWKPAKGFNLVAFGGADLRAMRATERLPLFVAGVGYPDFVEFTPEVVSKGTEAVTRAGFY